MRWSTFRIATKPRSSGASWFIIAAAVYSAYILHHPQIPPTRHIFDPRRIALLLLGGDKTGDDRWYEKNVPLADQIHDDYLAGVEEENNAKDDKVQRASGADVA